MPRNITVDDRNATQIVYYPSSCKGSGWTINEQRGYEGSFKYCITEPPQVPSITLKFNGTAVYYRSPTFNNTVVRFSLDGVISEDISLAAPANGQSTVNFTSSRIVWKQTTLENKEHTLEMFPSGGSTTLNFDAFTITEVETTPSVSASPASSTAKRAAAPPVDNSATDRLATGLGVTFGSISLIIFITIAYFLFKRNRALNRRYSWSAPVPQLPVEPTSTFGDRLFSQDSSHSPPNSPRMGEVVLPMRPLPSFPAASSSHREIDRENFVEDNYRTWSSPVPSQSMLLNPGASSSHGHESPSVSRSTTYTSKFEPVRRPTLPSAGQNRM
ncbi:hypothetical protein B0H34DRAFT_678749 [Crassisporium funariophilum]|nr:hypothetical protein B0H34DRAFT_678749 [Crassisporium funariophilum]